MKIKNVTLFFIGIIILILGLFIIIFDYPQLEFFERIDDESYYLLDEEKKNIHQKLMIEFTIGIVILGTGFSLLFLSFLKRFENGVR